MINLNSIELAQLSKQLKQDIDSWCAYKWDEGPRPHLGASEIGHSCNKYLWLKFRWTFYKKHDGRMQRLLNRGHFEESRFVSYLEGIGCNVYQFAKALWWHPESDYYFIDDVDFNEGKIDIDSQHCVDVTDIPAHLKLAEEQGIKFDKGKMQLRISACKGHFGGSLDAEVELPTRYNIPGKILGEFKTQGLGKQGAKVSNFDKLVKEGVKLYKPVHWAQQCIYGFKRNLKYSIYLSVCKNDDELHLEVVELDHALGADLERKAEMIIFAEEAPQGVSCSPGYYECSYCDAKSVCHLGAQPLRNCRSCCNSMPTNDGTWTCKFYGIIPKEVIPVEQPCWESII